MALPRLSGLSQPTSDVVCRAPAAQCKDEVVVMAAPSPDWGGTTWWCAASPPPNWGATRS